MLAFLPFVLSELSYASSKDHSYFSPGVDENGRSQYFTFHDDYYIVTYSPSEPYAQLGYEGANSQGGLMCKTPLKFSNFCIEVEFKIMPSGVPGMGLGFWLTKNKDYVSGNAYGRSEQIDGLLLAIDCQNKNPFIGIKLGNQKFNNEYTEVVNLKHSFYNSNIVLKLLNYANELKIFISVNKGNEQMIYSVKNSMLGDDLYYSLSASNLKGSSKTHIYNIKVSEVMFITDEKEGTRKSSKFVWIVFFGACAAIGYVLYKKQVVKPKDNRG